MKEAKEVRQKPTLKQIQRELKGTFAAIGVLLNECFYRDSGSNLLGISEEHVKENRLRGAMEEVNLDKTVIGRYLPIYYTYAYEGRVIPGYENEVQNWDTNIELLSDFMHIFASDWSYFDLCLDVVGIDNQTDVGYLRDMIDRVRARNALDNGDSLDISDLAILAEMNERSVKNALTTDGHSRLVADKNGKVENTEARRWLKDRRGFIPTSKQEFPENLSETPDQLDALEIPAFVRYRIAKRFEKNFLVNVALEMASSPTYDQAFLEYSDLISQVAEEAGLTPQTIQDAMQQPLRIKPEDCVAIAKVILVDPVWLTMQVLRALFPTPMDMVLNPSHYSSKSVSAEIEGNSVDVILSKAMIDHGYLDIPSHVKSIFPEDCFGTRKKDNTGKTVELFYGGRVEETDIRIKSENTISPRKRFNAWFQKELAAAPGDRIRITRTSERTYELTHVPK